MILRLKSAMQVLRDQAGGGSLRPELRPVTGGRELKKWPKRGHAVYGRSLINI